MPESARDLDHRPASRITGEPGSNADPGVGEGRGDSRERHGDEQGVTAERPAGSGAQHSYAGRPDQDVTENTGAGAGGATEWAGGGTNRHPSRVQGRPPGHGA